jgi:hypothetical protein
MLQLLGYEGNGSTVQLFDHKVDDTKKLQNSLRLLLRDASSTEDILDQQHADSKQISIALDLLPTLGMEFIRVAQASILAIEQGRLPELHQRPIEPKEIMEQINQGLSGMMGSTKEIVNTILAISAVDISLDGSFDIPTLIAGGQVAGLGATLSSAAAGLIALGYVGFKLSQAVHQFDNEQKNFIAYCIDDLASQQIAKTLQIYDEVMEELEERLINNLSRAYGIDKELFSERDAMARVLHSLKSARRDLATEIDRAQNLCLA